MNNDRSLSCRRSLTGMHSDAQFQRVVRSMSDLEPPDLAEQPQGHRRHFRHVLDSVAFREPADDHVSVADRFHFVDVEVFDDRVEHRVEVIQKVNHLQTTNPSRSLWVRWILSSFTGPAPPVNNSGHLVGQLRSFDPQSTNIIQQNDRERKIQIIRVSPEIANGEIRFVSIPFLIFGEYEPRHFYCNNLWPAGSIFKKQPTGYFYESLNQHHISLPAIYRWSNVK